MRQSLSTSGTAAAAAAAVGAALVVADLARGRSIPMMTVMMMMVVMMMLTVVRQLGVLHVAGRLTCHLKRFPSAISKRDALVERDKAAHAYSLSYHHSLEVALRFYAFSSARIAHSAGVRSKRWR